MVASRQIIALGGGGFSMEPRNPLLDLYILKQSGRETPKVCFIGTASGDAQGYIDRFYSSFKKLNCVPTHLSLFRGHTAEIEKFILDQDVLYVGGGNTRNLLTLWKDWGLDTAIRKAYERGTVLAGISAGSICWFEQGVTDSVPGQLSSLRCLGWLKGSNCPHYDGEAERRPSYHRLLKSGEILQGLATEDGVAAHYVNEELKDLVSSHPEKKAYSLNLKKGEPVEVSHSPKYLGGEVLLVRRAAIQDAEAIHRAHMKSIQEVCSKDHSFDEITAWGHRPYRKEQRTSSIKNDLVWVIEDHGTIEGFGHLKIFEKDGLKCGHIFGLYLTPKVLCKSLGKAIVDMMIEEMKSAKVKKVTLESTITAQKFYRKMGFVDDGSQITVEIGGTAVRCYPMKMEIYQGEN
ncbi:MAG: GNAT family N-acetyltransferase [Bdellovibrionaceae bacterium]|nr:GNAT family N-acetyltransferase [Pseudobdellovibrionaceae bacterium]